MNRLWGAIAAAVGLVLLAFWCTQHHSTSIATDLTTRASAALTAAGISTPTLTFSGRDATLSGTVATTDIRDQAARIVAGVRGVRVVRNDLTVSTANTPARSVPTATPSEKPKITAKVAAVVAPAQTDLDLRLEGKSIELRAQEGIDSWAI